MGHMLSVDIFIIFTAVGYLNISDLVLFLILYLTCPCLRKKVAFQHKKSKQRKFEDLVFKSWDILIISDLSVHF